MIKSFKTFNESNTSFKDINGKIPQIDDIIVHDNDEVGKVANFHSGRMLVDFRGHYLELNPNSSFEIINPNDKIKKSFNIVNKESDIVSMLKSLKRYDINTADNGEFIEQTASEDEDGKYIKSEDIDRIIQSLK